MNAHEISRGLGFFSLGLGLAELLAPRKVAQAAGINDDHDLLIRGLGAREVASGLAILSGMHTKESVWSRVLGDAVDLGLMAAAAKSPNTDRRKLTAAMIAVGSVTALDVFTSLRLTRGPRIDPKWRYTPANGRAGIEVRNHRQLPAPVAAAAPVASAPTEIRAPSSNGERPKPAGQPLELASAPQQAEPLR